MLGRCIHERRDAEGGRERDTHRAPRLTPNISKLVIKMAGGKQEWSGSETSREPTTPFHRYRFFVSLFTCPARECRQKQNSQNILPNMLCTAASKRRQTESASETERASERARNAESCAWTQVPRVPLCLGPCANPGSLSRSLSRSLSLSPSLLVCV